MVGEWGNTVLSKVIWFWREQAHAQSREVTNGVAKENSTTTRVVSQNGVELAKKEENGYGSERCRERVVDEARCMPYAQGGDMRVTQSGGAGAVADDDRVLEWRR